MSTMKPDRSEAAEVQGAGTVLDIASLTMSFGGLKAVDNVDLQIHRNEVLGLVGEKFLWLS